MGTPRRVPIILGNPHITPIMENDMEKQMEDEMAAGMHELIKMMGYLSETPKNKGC